MNLTITKGKDELRKAKTCDFAVDKSHACFEVPAGF